MSASQTPEDIISLLQDMERRSKQQAAGLGQRETVTESWTAIGFRIGQQHFVIPLNESREVFPLPQQVTTVPKSQPWVFGIVNLRGDLLPVLDLSLYLGGHGARLSKRSRVIVINDPEVNSGLLVDEVFGLKHFQRNPVPLDTASDNPYITGQVTQQNISWQVFSFQQLTADPRFLQAAA